MDNIEVEIRSIINEEQYLKLIEFFNVNAKFTKEDYQETYYFDSPQDLRIQKNNQGGKIWLKKGKLHDDAREEIEIPIKPEDFDKSQNLFETLGYNIEIKWLRKRLQYNWEDIKVTLDYTKGYAYIIELEILTNKENQESALNTLKSKMQELNIEITSKEIFNEKYEFYKKNWKKLI